MLLLKFFFFLGNLVNLYLVIFVEDVVWFNEFVCERLGVFFISVFCVLRKKFFFVDYEFCEWIEGIVVY